MNLRDLITKVEAYNPTGDIELLRSAYDFSARVHRGQKRSSGEPYLTHPLAVAGIIADLKLDVPSVATGLLHDTVEDTLATLDELTGLFGEEVAALVDGVTKISQINFTTREEKQAENFRKMILAMARDIRVILVKLADRTHNMRTLGHLAPDQQLEISQETLDIYAPLAHRLGINWVKSELEDGALRYLHPEVYYQLKRWLAKKKKEREKYIKEVLHVLGRKLGESEIEAEVTGRPKHFHSIYQKMQLQNLMYDQIYDLVAFRVIVDSVRECYEGLGVVHANWKPVPGRFKDYIALRKANLYQSLHTTVIGPYGERMEVQIRTQEMHRVAEHGIAAHWRYKGGPGTIPPDEAQHFAWLKQLVEWQQDLKDPDEFLASVKDDLFSEEVYVFTPKGDLLSFPEGASVIDFAYRIHSEVGNRCTGARVNGVLVPLRYRLQGGDTVEIVTTSHQTPSKDWLKIVKTPRASSRIRGWIKAQQRTRSLALGKELLERDLGRYRLDLSKLRKDGRLAGAFEELGFHDEDGLLAAIGYGRTTTRQVLGKLLPPDELQERLKPEGALQRLFRQVARQQSTGVRVSGVGDLLVRFGKCCSPLPGERLAGFITRGRGVTVHSVGCPRALDSDPERRVDVSWAGDAQTLRPVKVEVVSVDQPGMLAAVSNVISSSGINIARAEVQTESEEKAMSTFHLMVRNAEDLNRVLRSIGKIRGVLRVNRVRA